MMDIDAATLGVVLAAMADEIDRSTDLRRRLSVRLWRLAEAETGAVDADTRAALTAVAAGLEHRDTAREVA